MKKTYLLFLAVPVLVFTLLWLSIWWFVGGMIAFMLFIAYQFYASRLHASQARTEVLEKELEDLHVHLENTVLKEQKTSKEAQQVRQSKQQLLTVIGHEIRTPMNGILGMSLLLEDTSLSKEQQEYVNTIKSSGEILLTTINNLLVNDIIDFSKLQQEGSQLEYKSFDLRDSIEEVLELFAKRAGQANIDIAYQMDADVPEQIIGDAKQLRQLLMNLVDNAVKFTKHGEVLVGIHRGPSLKPGYPPELSIEVRDSGIGIPADQVKHLFKGIPGKESQRTKKNEHTGLGLVVCKKIVELMGGTIEVKSQPGEGTIISFSVPITPNLKIGRSNAQQSNLSNLEGKKILIVDDNATSLAVLASQVKSWKMLPVTVDAAEKALEKLSREPIDIVVIDIDMPVMNGIELAKAIKEKYPSIPLIGMNYPADEKLKLEPAALPVVINKPARRHVLRDQLLAGLSQSTGGKQAALNQVSDDFSQRYPLRILIAEDNLVNQKIAVKILNKLGYQPVIANNGKEAMEIVGQETYDIILMDVQMPEMNGLEATRMIRTCLEVQPVIIAMTANVMQGDRDECLQAGMDDYMSKPIDLSELLSQLEKWSLVLRDRRKMSA